MNENYEVMEQETIETEVAEGVMEEATESKSGLGLAALIVGGGVALVGLGIAGVKKLKAKNADKPKTKLKFFVRVPVEEDVVEIPTEEFVDEDVE